MLGRNAIEVNLAKPLSDKRKQAQSKREQRKPFDGPFNPRASLAENPPSRPPAGNFGGFNNNNPSRGGGGGRSNDSFS
jgi:hypothetical protein